MIEQLEKLKKERDAIIVAHIYQSPEIQDIADFVGDSLDLSRKAASTDAKTIVFCGVKFMAETAKILSPQKTVLMPDIGAGCPMADMINADEVKKLKQQYPKHKVVAYVNTSAEVKAESYICCTSANAVEIVNSIDGGIIFVPDRNLGAFVQKKSGKPMIIASGFCPTHNNFILPEFIIEAKNAHPNACVLVHPECRPEVIDLADFAMSTGQMCRYIPTTSQKEFIIGTENGIIYRLQKDNPGKTFYPVNTLATCPNMKKTNLAKVLTALLENKNQITIPQEIAQKAKKPIKRMLEI
ncbi:MAG: quinolinate synthase NadA [Endomicrobium sp.]|jgi:quinolinate synthase|nr:quinolinate synthase NadA [Endomicrobium sp.]